MLNAMASLATAAIVSGLGSYLPAEVISNETVAASCNSSAEWIQSRTGITSRHRVSIGQGASDLAVQAGLQAIASAGNPDIDGVILATATPDYLLPATAPDVAAQLGCAGAAAFDVSAACSGFIYALACGTGLISTGACERVLVVASEVYSTVVSPFDRDTAALFGDGSGAVVLQSGSPDSRGAIGPIVLGSNGSDRDLAIRPVGGSRQPALPDSKPGDDIFLRMRGREIFRQAVKCMTEAALAAVDQAGWPLADVDYVIAHQANIRIITALQQNLDIPSTKILTNISDVGNTGAASIPILLQSAVADGTVQPGDKILLVAFGAGLAWGATTLIWPGFQTDTAGMYSNESL
jgi:3-oxoacyl-[acyl-carrier-protein] synthase-3